MNIRRNEAEGQGKSNEIILILGYYAKLVLINKLNKENKIKYEKNNESTKVRNIRLNYPATSIAQSSVAQVSLKVRRVSYFCATTSSESMVLHPAFLCTLNHVSRLSESHRSIVFHQNGLGKTADTIAHTTLAAQVSHPFRLWKAFN